MLQCHSTFYVLCVLMSHMLVIDAAYRVNTHCELGLCLVLYRSENTNKIHFGPSREVCSNESMDSASITDPSVQQMIPTLLSAFDMANNTAGEAWTAGLRQTVDTEWKYLNGTVFENHSLIEDVHQDSGNCAFLKAGHMLVMDQCDEINGNQYPFCHFPKTEQESCSSGRHFIYKDLCYYVHNEEYGNGGWYDAQNFCHTVIGGDLAYKHILELRDTLKQRGFPRNLWIGITRHQWRWIASNLVMRYFNWGPGFNESITDTRVVISPRNFRWQMYDAATKLNYVICSREDDSYTTTEATTTTKHSPSIGDTSNVDIGVGTTTVVDATTARNSQTFPVGAVAGSVSAIAGVAVVVAVVVVLCVRKRHREEKQQPKTSHVYANERVSPSKPSQSAEHHEPELDYEDVGGYAKEADYSSVDLDLADNTDQITPYGEYKPTAVKESNTNNRITGLVQTARPKTQGDNKDDDLSEIAIYSQPMKATKRKTTDVATANKPTINKGKRKGNTKRSSKPEVIHVEAPSGDVYAVANRNVGANQHAPEVLGLL